jgi:hypothetical protein
MPVLDTYLIGLALHMFRHDGQYFTQRLHLFGAWCRQALSFQHGWNGLDRANDSYVTVNCAMFRRASWAILG